ncbi:MAG: GlmU family protein [Bacteroidales bacterium]|nr:GlmU family protein [Bacteroidales bacterium]
MNFILSDGVTRDRLLPFTFTRPVADIRIGILTIREKWEFLLKTNTSSFTQDYLSQKYPLKTEAENILIDGSIIPDVHLVDEIKKLKEGESLKCGDLTIASFLSAKKIEKRVLAGKTVEYKGALFQVANLWDIYAKNHQAIHQDFEMLTNGRKSQPLSSTNFINGDPSLIFLEEGAKSEFAIFNTHDGPVYLGKDSEVMEGAKIRGPFALCEHSLVKMDAKIYTGTTIGPHSKVGGEVSNSVIFGYSNKAHDGFLGNSVLGEWCNLGADTNVSNLKNTYDMVKLWSYSTGRFENTGQQFCGLMMGDHSKSGINTMFNTGTVVGVSANVFGEGYLRNFVPSFSWGGKSGMSRFKLDKAFEVASVVFKRRNKVFDDVEKNIFTYLYEMTFPKAEN